MKKILTIVLFSSFFVVFAQNTSKKLKIYLDCQTYCYTTYLKENLHYVEFVRDRHYADVYIMITSQENGSGGDTYYLEFSGNNEYKDIHKKITFNTSSDDPKEKIRKKLLKFIILGLTDYWLKAGYDDVFNIKLNTIDKGHKKEVNDPWNYWVFSMNAGGWANGNENYNSLSYNTGISAKQVKEKTKFRFGLRYGKGKSVYKFNNQTFVKYKEYFSASASEILAINNHWSYGFFGRFKRSVYSNYKFSGKVSAGLEYNFFPYSQSSKHALVLQAKLGFLNNKYFEKTIYEKYEDNLFDTNMLLSLKLIRKWGNLDFSVDYHQFLHDAQLRSFSFNTYINLRLFKGFSVYWSGMYSIQHDQINISGANLSLQELLLEQRELLSGYDYYASFGVRYSFGSIYNTIVNPRFSGARSSVIYIF